MDELGLVVVAKCVTVQAPHSKDGQVTDMAAKTQQHDLLLVTDMAAKTKQHDLLLVTDMAAKNTTA